MGAWGTGAFENDAACDWASDLERSSDLSLVRQALGRTLAVGGDYLDADVACEALAACEVVARLKGNWGPRSPYTERADSWVASLHSAPPASLIDAAVSAIDRVLSRPSELLDLWAESDEYDSWLDSVRELRGRVRG